MYVPKDSRNKGLFGKIERYIRGTTVEQYKRKDSIMGVFRAIGEFANRKVEEQKMKAEKAYNSIMMQDMPLNFKLEEAMKKYEACYNKSEIAMASGYRKAIIELAESNEITDQDLQNHYDREISWGKKYNALKVLADVMCDKGLVEKTETGYHKTW